MVKNSDYKYDPLTDILEMSQQDNFSSEKLYIIFTRCDAGNILFQLILNHSINALKIAEILSVQYEHEFKELIDT